MNYAVIILAFLVGGAIATRAGMEMGFMCVYLPVQFFWGSVPPIPIAYWPHISPPHAVIYGVLLGGLMSGRKFPHVRLCLLDGVMVTVLLAYGISAGVTKDLHAFANVADTQVMEWLMPYILARLAFTSEAARAAGLRVLVVCLMFLGVIGFIETRFLPYFFSRQLESIGLYVGLNSMVYHRFGFMRAQLAFQHPIDLGNVMLMLIGIIPMLALTCQAGMKKWYVRAGWAATIFLLVTAISFTAYFGLAMMAGMYLLLKYVRGLRRHLAVIAVLGIAAISVYTAIVLSEKMPPRPPDNDIFAGSLWIRQLIVHRGWAMAKNAGWFGFGSSIDLHELQLDSVDNAYILMVLMQGWITLVCFLLVPVALGARLSRALRNAANEIEARPLIVAAATMSGIMIAMYTVWFGFVYANIFVVLVGFSATLAEFFLVRGVEIVEDADWNSEEDEVLPGLVE